nr:phosphoribosylanthranilate isomerase [Butyrivibrio sp.]
MTKVKICGITTEEDCEIMNCFKPDYVGFVFANTRHKLEDDQAAKFRNLINKEIPTVGVFVDDEIEHIANLYNSGVINIIQLHGNEDEKYIKELREEIKKEKIEDKHEIEDFENDVPIIKAARVKDGSEIEEVEKLSCDMMLLDNYDK